MNEKKRTEWINKDHDLNKWWKESAETKRDFVRKYSKELDARIREKVNASLAPKTSSEVTPAPSEQSETVE